MKIAPIGVTVIIIVSMSIIRTSAYTTLDNNNKLYYAENETSTNYYAIYSIWTNCSCYSKYHIVSSIVYSSSDYIYKI